MNHIAYIYLHETARIYACFQNFMNLHVCIVYRYLLSVKATLNTSTYTYLHEYTKLALFEVKFMPGVKLIVDVFLKAHCYVRAATVKFTVEQNL